MASMDQIRLEIETSDGLLSQENGEDLLQEDGDTIGVDGYGFADVWPDVVDAVTYEYGIKDNKFTDRVASVGSMTFFLNNSITCSGATAGYYSPGHASARPGFDIERGARLVFNNGTDHYIWKGRIAKITPAPDVYGPRKTYVECEDQMVEYAELQNLGLQEFQQAVTSDELFTTISALLENPPSDSDFSPGRELTYVFTKSGSRQSGRAEIEKICASTLDYFSPKSDEIYGGTIKSQTYNDRITNTTVALTLSAIKGLEVSRDRTKKLDKATAITYPLLVGETEEIIYSLTEPFLLRPNTSTTLVVDYRDPDDPSAAIAAFDVDETPTPITDYGAYSRKRTNLVSGGLTDLLSVTVEAGTRSAEVTYTNSSTTRSIWVTRHDIRGYALRSREQQRSTAEVAEPTGDRELNLDLVYQQDVNFGDSVADLAIYLYGESQDIVESVTYNANLSSTLIDAAAEVTFGDRVVLSETQTGLSSYAGIVNGVRGRVYNHEFIDVTYLLEKAPPAGGWQINKVGASEVGSTTNVRGI